MAQGSSNPTVKIGTVGSLATVINALNGTVSLDVSSVNGAGFVITAVSSPSNITLVPEISLDGGTNWITTFFDNPNGDKEANIPNASLAVGVTRAIVTSNGTTHVRVRASTFTSGSVTVQLRGTQLNDPSVLFGGTNNSTTRPPITAQVGGWDGANLRSLSTNASGHVNIADGSNSITVDAPIGTPVHVRHTDGTNTMPTADNAARSIFSRVTDGSNTATVKAASTAAAAADPALVVSVSPNTAVVLGAGTAGIGKLTANDGIDIGDVTINNAIGSGAYVRLTDGTNTMPTGDAAARGVYHRVTDGTNTAAVKAASTAAAAADPALVVSVSPNTAVVLGAGTAGIGKLTANDGVDIGDVTINNAIGSGAYVRLTDGTNTMPTGDAASRGIFVRNTDGTNTAAVKAASTAAAATDPALVVAVSPNNAVSTVASQSTVALSGVVIADLIGGFTCTSTRLSAGQLVTISGTFGGTGTITGYASPTTYRISTTNGSTSFTLVTLAGAALTTTTGTPTGVTYTVRQEYETSILNLPTPSSPAVSLAGLNQAVSLDVSSASGAGMVITSVSSPSGITLVPEVSYDFGANWVATYFDNPNGDKEANIPNASLATGVSRTIVTAGGVTHVRVRVSAFTSGSVNVQIRGTQLVDPSVLFAGTNNSTSRPPTTAQVGGWDGSNLRAISTNASGHINIADGGNIITVDGTVGATQSGTWNIATVTNLSQLGGQAISMNTGVRDAGTQRVTIATNDSLAVTGTFFQATQPVSIAATVGTNIAQVGGTNVVTGGTAGTLGIAGIQAHDAAVSNNNPVLIGGVASANAPTAVADGDVTRLWTTTTGALNVADGGSSISIDDGGNIITVDGTVTANQGGTWNINTVSTVTNLSQLGGTAISMNTGVRDAGTQRVTIATNDSLAVTGTFWQATQPVSIAATVGTNIAQVGGTNVVTGGTAGTLGIAGIQAHDAAVSGNNPVLIGGVANAAAPTAVADGDVTRLWTTTTGALNVADGGTTLSIDDGGSSISIDDGGNIITVDGTVTANQGGTWTVQPGNTQNTTPWLVTSGVTLSTPNTPSITLSATAGTIPAATYYFRLVAADAFGGMSLPSNETTWSPIANSAFDITISSVNVSGVDHYRLFYSTTSGNYSTGNYIKLDSYKATITALSASGTVTLPTANTSYDSKNKLNVAVSDPNNSTTTNLLGGGVFTGTSTDISEFAQISISIYSSHGSATNGVSVQFSQDGTNWDQTNTYTVSATSETSVILATRLKFFRLVYTNGATTTTTLRIQSRLRRVASTSSIKELTATVKEQDLALQTRSVLNGRDTPSGTTYNDVVVKPASTAAAATDTALVVAISPNNTVAATQSGTWNIGTVSTVSTVTNLSQLGGTAISMNTGVRDAGTQRVTIATNDVVPASQSGTWNIGTLTNQTQMNGQAISMGTGVRDAGTQRVTIATNDSVPVTGTFWQATQPVSIAATVGVNLAQVGGTNVVTGGTAGTQAIGGIQAHDAAVSNNNPVLIGGVANAAAPTAVADGDVTRLWTTTTGALNVADGGSSISIDDGGNIITVDGTISANQSGTWTVQPGNTQNTTPWLVTSGVTLSTPSTPTIATSATAGTIPAASYYFRLVAADAFGGTSLPSIETTAWTIASPSAVDVTVATIRDPGIDHYRLYYTTTAGNYSTGNYVRLDSYATTLTTLSASGTVTLPTANTTFDSRNKVASAVSDTNNSTTKNLGASAVFTGASTDISEFAQISISVYSSHASATNGMSLQFSQDGSNWDQVNTYTVAATTEASVILATRLRYFRLVYTNGGTLTTTLRIQTRLWRAASPSTIKELLVPVKEQDLALQTRSVLNGRDTPAGTTYNDVVVKPASTAAAATDTALVVAVRDAVVLGAGTAGIGKLTANSGVTIGTVEIAGSQTLATVTNLSQLGGQAIAMGTGARSAGTQRVTIATDDVVPASQSGTWNIATLTNQTQMNGQAISMGTGVRDAGTQRVTIATNDVVPASQSGTWNIGTVTAVTGITNALPTGTNTIGAVNHAARVSSNLDTTVSGSTYVSSSVVKAAAGTLYMLNGYNSKTTGQFIQIHNATSLPANGSTPIGLFYVPPQSNFSFDFGVYGKPCITGIVVCNSTTAPTLTLGSADVWFEVLYK